MNKIAGYRKMCGLRQKDVAEFLGISLQSYNAKENKKRKFNEYEIELFMKLINQFIPDLKATDIFFEQRLKEVDTEVKSNEHSF